MYGYDLYFGNPENVAMTVALVSTITSYSLTLLNYKQISYISRAAMAMTVLVIVFITVAVFYKAYYQYLYSPIESIIMPDTTLESNASSYPVTNSTHVSGSNSTHISHSAAPTPGLEHLYINWFSPFFPYFLN